MSAPVGEEQRDRDILARRSGADAGVKDLVVAEHGRMGVGPVRWSDSAPAVYSSPPHEHQDARRRPGMGPHARQRQDSDR